MAFGKREDFFLFSCVMEATMIDKKMGEKQLQIEVSCGNAGNSIDGQMTSASKTGGDTDSIASGNYDDGGKSNILQIDFIDRDFSSRTKRKFSTN